MLLMAIDKCKAAFDFNRYPGARCLNFTQVEGAAEQSDFLSSRPKEFIHKTDFGLQHLRVFQ